MSLPPLLNLYGGKWRATHNTARYLPPRPLDTIIEPFAGGAGYSFRHGADRKVVLYEKDHRLVMAWSFLLRASQTEVLSLPDLPEDGDVRDLPIPEEAKYLIARWVNRGTAVPCWRWSGWARNYRHRWPSLFWSETVRRKIARCLPRMENWSIVHADYSRAIDHLANNCTYFVDPPYSSKPGRRYPESGPHDAQERAKWFDEIGDWCRGLAEVDARVIVCENHGADWLDFGDPVAELAANGNRRSLEVVWTNPG